MPLYYLDTSALVKRYHQELGSERVNRLFEDPAASFFTSNLTLTELTSALDRKVQDATITDEAVATVMAVVARDFLERIWLIDLERHHITQSQALIRRYHLRTLDALHLSVLLTARSAMPILISADRQFLAAAEAEQVAVLDPTV